MIRDRHAVRSPVYRINRPLRLALNRNSLSLLSVYIGLWSFESAAGTGGAGYSGIILIPQTWLLIIAVNVILHITLVCVHRN